MMLSPFQIPDNVTFTHQYLIDNPLCCGEYSEKSVFAIPGLGTFQIGYYMDLKCFYFYQPRFQRFRPPGCCEFDYHFFKRPDYQTNNGQIQLEYWEGGKGIVRVGGMPLVEFTTTRLNPCDVLYAHWFSGYPKLSITFPLDPGRPKLILRPDPSPCPETCLSGCPFFSLCGLCTSERQFHVEGLTQGNCTITNTRTCSEACAKVCLLQGRCCCPHVDYPSFNVNFQNVLPIDKFAILMGLVHYSYYKKWYVIVRIEHQVVGMV